jgi:hypothetical protein
MIRSKVMLHLVIIGCLFGCDGNEPTRRARIKKVGNASYTYNQSSQVVQISDPNGLQSTFEYENEELVRVVNNRSKEIPLDSILFFYTDGFLSSSIEKNYDGNPVENMLVSSLYSQYIFVEEQLDRKIDSINYYYNNSLVPDSTTMRDISFAYNGLQLVSKRELFSDNTVIEFTFEYDDKNNSYIGIFGSNLLYHSPQLVESDLANGQSVWPALFQTLNNIVAISYTRNKGCGYGDPAGGSLTLSFEYNQQLNPTRMTRGLVDSCQGIGPDSQEIGIEYE